MEEKSEASVLSEGNSNYEKHAKQNTLRLVVRFRHI